MRADQFRTTPASRGAVLVLVCLLRARAARMVGQDARAMGWAILGVAAICWWPGWWLWWWAWKETGGEAACLGQAE